MTIEEKLKILKDAETRSYQIQVAIRQIETGVKYLLEVITAQAWAAQLFEPAVDAFVPEPDCDKDAVKPKPDKEPQNTEEPAPGGDEEPKITKEDVRKKLAMYQTNANLDIPSLMQSMGYSKLSEVPASRYRELLEKAQKIVDGEG